MMNTIRGYRVGREGLIQFNRDLFDSSQPFTCIGQGELGGKAQGLAFIRDMLDRRGPAINQSEISVSVPNLTVITTSLFDGFMQSNGLYSLEFDDLPDDQIALTFQQSDLPAELVGDLYGLVAKVHTPLAIRSSSLLEDALYEPFAGVYATKMVPNNQFDVGTRFQKLIEAVKFVYASTFFRRARDYVRATGHRPEDEKMAVVVQAIVGQRFGDRFYPHISGVARSFNYYPTGHALPQQGVVTLALGLGKTIVDGGKAYQYSPAHPRGNPIYSSINELLDQSQSYFWAVNMGKPPEYDPIRETEYLCHCPLAAAEEDGTLRMVASTYKAGEDRIAAGLAGPGPRLVNFAPILQFGDIPLNEAVTDLLKLCGDELGSAIEMEFAVSIQSEPETVVHFGFLQVRPMVVSTATVDVSTEEMTGSRVVAASESVMGNGATDTIRDVVYVRPEKFQAAHSRIIADELAQVNRKLVDARRPYLLIGFGRWGSSDPWLGIPVDWSQVAGAKVIIEATLPNMVVELSQGSHFFHNISSFQVLYFCMAHTDEHQIDWNWLHRQQVAAETPYVCHVSLDAPLRIKVDGRTRRGLITHD